MTDSLVTHLKAVAIDHQNGIFRGETDVVERIGGQPPQTLDAFIRENRTVFGAAEAGRHELCAVRDANESIPKLVETRVTSGRSGCGMSLAIGMDDPEFLLNRGTERREVAIAE